VDRDLNIRTLYIYSGVKATGEVPQEVFGVISDFNKIIEIIGTYGYAF